MILFLDIDGVLPDSPQPDVRLRALPRLVEVLRDFLQVEVVISSLWREAPVARSAARPVPGL